MTCRWRLGNYGVPSQQGDFKRMWELPCGDKIQSVAQGGSVLCSYIRYEVWGPGITMLMNARAAGIAQRLLDSYHESEWQGSCPKVLVFQRCVTLRFRCLAQDSPNRASISRVITRTCFNCEHRPNR